MNGLEIEVQEAGARLMVRGELDANSAAELAEHLRQAPTDVAVDLGDCSFMDSRGVSVLVEAKSGPCPDLLVTAVSRPVELVLSISGLLEVLTEGHGRAPLP